MMQATALAARVPASEQLLWCQKLRACIPCTSTFNIKFNLSLLLSLLLLLRLLHRCPDVPTPC